MRTKVNLYNELEDGNILYEKKSSSEIAALIGKEQKVVIRAASRGYLLDGRYKIELAQEYAADGNYREKLKLLEEWDAARAPFLRVTWVKEKGDGVKCLK